MHVVDCVTADVLLLCRGGGNGCVDPECEMTGLKDFIAVSRAGDNGVTTAGDDGINKNVSFRVFQSSVVESINALRQDVEGLRSEIRHIKTVVASTQLTQDHFCLIYVRAVGGMLSGENHLGKDKLESLLACEVLQYVCLGDRSFPSFKVRIRESDLECAMAEGKMSGCVVVKWCNTGRRYYNPAVTHPSRAPITCNFSRSRSSFKMSCWNCRGLSSSVPYLNYLLEKGTKILVLLEHWL